MRNINLFVEDGGPQEFREDQAPYALPTETESPQP